MSPEQRYIIGKKTTAALFVAALGAGLAASWKESPHHRRRNFARKIVRFFQDLPETIDDINRGNDFVQAMHRLSQGVEIHGIRDIRARFPGDTEQQNGFVRWLAASRPRHSGSLMDDMRKDDIKAMEWDSKFPYLYVQVLHRKDEPIFRGLVTGNHLRVSTMESLE